MSRAIICCDCPGIPARAKAAYSAKIKGELPKVYEGKNAVSGLADRLPQGTNIEQHIRALSKNKEKYAYYFVWESDGTITTKYNLLTGRNVA